MGQHQSTADKKARSNVIFSGRNSLRRNSGRRAKNQRPLSMLVQVAPQIFDKMDTDGSGSVSRVEILDFLEAWGLSRLEMAGHLDKTFAKFDDDGSGELEKEEFVSLLAALEDSRIVSLRALVIKDGIFWASCLVVIASAFAILSALLQSLNGGEKKTGGDTGMTGGLWKALDYPKAAFLGVRGFVMFLHQFKHFRVEAHRYHHIYTALEKAGTKLLLEPQHRDQQHKL